MMLRLPKKSRRKYENRISFHPEIRFYSFLRRTKAQKRSKFMTNLHYLHISEKNHLKKFFSFHKLVILYH